MASTTWSTTPASDSTARSTPAFGPDASGNWTHRPLAADAAVSDRHHDETAHGAVLGATTPADVADRVFDATTQPSPLVGGRLRVACALARSVPDAWLARVSDRL